MNTVESGSSLHLPTFSRAVVSLAIGVAHTVERAIGGDARTRAAQANAIAAVLADQDRARRCEEIRRSVAALAVARPTTRGATGPGGRAGAGQLTVGSSPRSSASHASRVR